MSITRNIRSDYDIENWTATKNKKDKKNKRNGEFQRLTLNSIVAKSPIKVAASAVTKGNRKKLQKLYKISNSSKVAPISLWKNSLSRKYLTKVSSQRNPEIFECCIQKFISDTREWLSKRLNCDIDEDGNCLPGKRKGYSRKKRTLEIISAGNENKENENKSEKKKSCELCRQSALRQESTLKARDNKLLQRILEPHKKSKDPQQTLDQRDERPNEQKGPLFLCDETSRLRLLALEAPHKVKILKCRHCGEIAKVKLRKTDPRGKKSQRQRRRDESSEKPRKPKRKRKFGDCSEKTAEQRRGSCEQLDKDPLQPPSKLPAAAKSQKPQCRNNESDKSLQEQKGRLDDRWCGEESQQQRLQALEPREETQRNPSPRSTKGPICYPIERLASRHQIGSVSSRAAVNTVESQSADPDRCRSAGLAKRQTIRSAPRRPVRPSETTRPAADRSMKKRNERGPARGDEFKENPDEYYVPVGKRPRSPEASSVDGMWCKCRSPIVVIPESRPAPKKPEPRRREKRHFNFTDDPRGRTLKLA